MPAVRRCRRRSAPSSSTNITPDPETGIGHWSEAAFLRALREGVDRAGRHLYPAFPYDHFTKLTDEDIGALYAFLMTRRAVRAPAQANRLSFPFNWRPLLAGWKLLYLTRGPAQGNEASDRGAYLVEALAHCGSCHTPRNRFGAEERSRTFAGGEAEDWHAPALNADSPAPHPWTRDQLFTYLRRGFVEPHGVAAGPMQSVDQQSRFGARRGRPGDRRLCRAHAGAGDRRAAKTKRNSCKRKPMARAAPSGVQRRRRRARRAARVPTRRPAR